MVKEFNPEQARKEIYGEGVIHLTASGFDKTFCGLNSDEVKNTSLGCCCNCNKCMEEAQKIMENTLKAERDKKKFNNAPVTIVK